MLVVRGVNQCRYCAYGHARLASRAGVSRAEVQNLLGGSGRTAPDLEVPALLYARHWAECDGRPTLEAVRALEADYGVEKARTIELFLRLIRIGNLVGNAWDEALCSLSRGRWGCEHASQGQS
jgi:AhpD family alkylhydroperoxidase